MQIPEKNDAEMSVHKNSTPQSILLKAQRDFAVPVKRLFAAFKTSEALKAWWWPEGLEADRVEIDFRKGGSYFISMKTGGHSEGGMSGTFQEIKEEALILMTDNFADKNGAAITAEEAKVPGVWPETVYITFEFASVGEKSSRLNFFQEGIPMEMYEDCKKGWSQMFDKLEKYLTVVD